MNNTEFPPTTFEYDSITGWQRSSSLTPPVDFSGREQGERIADVNGDGMDDFLQGYQFGDYGSELTLSTGINTGNGWEFNNSWAPPTYFVNDQNYRGAQLADVNGDGLVDIIRKDNGLASAWINNGTGWEQNNTWIPPIHRVYLKILLEPFSSTS